MYVEEIYTDVKDVLGKCSEEQIFKTLTQAVNMLARKARWDSTLGVMDICVCNSCITLPREVKTVLQVATNGRPNVLRDAWFWGHINGLGVTDCVSQGYSEVAGTFCTVRDPSNPVYIVAQLESALDNNKDLRVFGLDVNGNKIYTPNPDTGVMEEGWKIPTVAGYPIRADGVPLVKSLYRVSKEVFSARVRLLAINEDLSPHTVIGYYEPDETEPNYTRLKVGHHSWVRVRYQKADSKIRSQRDWINIADTQAILLACRAVKLRSDMDIDLAAKYENEATRLLTEEQKSLQPATLNGPQIINSDSFNFACQNSAMFYGGGGGWN